MTLIRYRAKRPQSLGWGRISGNFTGYANNAVLIDGSDDCQDGRCVP